MHGARTVMGGIVENVDGGVACADHEHALALELLLRFHIVRVKDLAGEAAGIARPVRVPMMAVGDDEPVIETRLCLTFDLDAPAPVGALGRGNPRIECDAVVKPKLPRVGAQIVLRLSPAQIMRPLLRHFEVGVLRQLLGGIEIGRAVDHVRILRIPDAADIGIGLEAIERNAALGEGLGDRQAAGPSANDAISFHGLSRQITAPSILGPTRRG